jgi:hypothetical protein
MGTIVRVPGRLTALPYAIGGIEKTVCGSDSSGATTTTGTTSQGCGWCDTDAGNFKGLGGTGMSGIIGIRLGIELDSGRRLRVGGRSKTATSGGGSGGSRGGDRQL